jgi:hypothetical protein
MLNLTVQKYMFSNPIEPLVLLWHFRKVIGLRPDFDNVPNKGYQRFAPLVHGTSV